MSEREARRQNGAIPGCLLAEEHWQRYFAASQDAIKKVNEMHGAFATLSKNSEHLSALPEIKDTLLKAAISADHTDNRTVRMLVYILGTVILALTAMLTGQHFGWIPGK